MITNMEQQSLMVWRMTSAKETECRHYVRKLNTSTISGFYSTVTFILDIVLEVGECYFVSIFMCNFYEAEFISFV